MVVQAFQGVTQATGVLDDLADGIQSGHSGFFSLPATGQRGVIEGHLVGVGPELLGRLFEVFPQLEGDAAQLASRRTAFKLSQHRLCVVIVEGESPNIPFDCQSDPVGVLGHDDSTDGVVCPVEHIQDGHRLFDLVLGAGPKCSAFWQGAEHLFIHDDKAFHGVFRCCSN